MDYLDRMKKALLGTHTKEEQAFREYQAATGGT